MRMDSSSTKPQGHLNLDSCRRSADVWYRPPLWSSRRQNATFEPAARSTWHSTRNCGWKMSVGRFGMVWR
jgi:hypothetical protein